MTNLVHQYAKTDGPGGSTSYNRTGLGNGRGTKSNLAAKLEIGTDNLNAGDTWTFFRLPAKTVITNAWLEVDDLDTATSLTLDFGYTDDPDAWADASTAGQAGGTITGTAGNLPYTGDTADYDVLATVDIAPGTAQAGSVTCFIECFRLD